MIFLVDYYIVILASTWTIISWLGYLLFPIKCKISDARCVYLLCEISSFTDIYNKTKSLDSFRHQLTMKINITCYSDAIVINKRSMGFHSELENEWSTSFFYPLGLQHAQYYHLLIPKARNLTHQCLSVSRCWQHSG